MSEPMRFNLKHFGQISTMEVAKDGEFVLHSENARLKAEVDNSNRINTELLLLSNKQASEVRRLTAELSNISGWGRGLESDLSHARVEISFLKAEVEQLTERNKFLEQIDSYLQGANENAYEKRCDELEAEVERLRKAGDAMAYSAYAHCMCQDCEEIRDQWRDAKRGNQP